MANAWTVAGTAVLVIGIVVVVYAALASWMKSLSLPQPGFLATTLFSGISYLLLIGIVVAVIGAILLAMGLTRT